MHETFARFLALLEMTRDVLDNIYIIIIAKIYGFLQAKYNKRLSFC